jgi:phosphatidylglycerophosphatase A
MLVERVAYAIATAGFVGRFPIAPGTVGSIAGLGIYGLLRWFGDYRLEAVAIVATLVLGVWAAGVAERLLGGKDPGPIVIDEVLGMLITLAFLDVNVGGAIVGFFLFRVADVLKPFPAGRMEHLPGGYGVMLDDLVAALYSHAGTRLLVTWMPGWLA